MNEISHPLIGDPKYGDKNHNVIFIDDFNCENLFLHPIHLSLLILFLKKKTVIKSNLPNNWNTVFKRFDRTI